MEANPTTSRKAKSKGRGCGGGGGRSREKSHLQQPKEFGCLNLASHQGSERTVSH